MKRTLLLLAAATLFACSPKTNKSAASTVAPAPAGSSEPTEAQLTAAKTRFPDVTMETLKKGQTIYYGPCTHCHGDKGINRRDEKEWSAVLDDMAPKAKLSAEEKDAVWKYIMSVRLASKK